MKKKYMLSNAFSIQMLDTSVAHTVSITPIEPAQIPSDCVSAIGHADTARVVSTILHRSVPCNRMNVRLTEHDTLYIAQLISGRLPEGSTTLPEGFQIVFLKVQVKA